MTRIETWTDEDNVWYARVDSSAQNSAQSAIREIEKRSHRRGITVRLIRTDDPNSTTWMSMWCYDDSWDH